MALEKLEQAFDRHPKRWYYTSLACAVCVLFLLINAYLLCTGREPIWTQDHRSLYANFLIWACQTFTDAVASAQSGNGFELPMYTYSMGYGSDVPMAMGSYLHDPINIIVAVMPKELIGVSYPLMTLARLILAAFAFSWYCFGHGHGRRATGIASLVYVTCGFIMLLGALRHPKFIDWAITLPLILRGADCLFEGKKPTLFVVALVLQFCISIYFSYMSCVVLLVYCLIKYFLMPRKRGVPDFAFLVSKFVFFGLVAFAVSAVFSLPQIMALLSQGRATSGETVVPMFFTLKYYAKIAAHLIGADGTTDGLLLSGMATICILVFIFCKDRFDPARWRAWLVGLILCIAGVLSPFLSHIMNGMGYATDRWMLVLGFVASYIVCLAFPTLQSLSSKELKRVSIGVAVFAVLTVAFGVAQLWMSDGIGATVWPLCMAVVFVALFFLVRHLRKVGSLQAVLYCGGAVMLCAALSCMFFCLPIGKNWGSTFPKSGQTWSYISDKSPAAAMEQIDDGSLYRYSLPRVFNLMKNSPLAHNLMGVDYYTSFYNQNVDDLRQDLGISDHYKNYSYVGSDSRLAVEDLAGVKYYISKSKDFWRVPYGFEDVGIEYNGYHLFENKTPVPLAYLAPGVLPLSDYEKLTMAQKQEALLQRAVLDDETAAKMPGETEAASGSASLDLTSQEIPYEVSDMKGLEFEKGGKGIVRATQKQATLTLTFSGLEKSETYLSFENLHFRGYKPSELAKMKGKSAGLKQTVSDLLWSEYTTYDIMAASGTRTNTTENATPRNQSYGGKVDWIFNLAYSDEPVQTMTITFYEPGEYTFDALKVVCQPTEPVVQKAQVLASNALQDLKLDVNRISATATLEDDAPHLAVFTFAYTPGWSVTVDGQPAEAHKADVAFLGVEVSGRGAHSIEWTYTTPGLKTGFMLTMAGIGVCIVLLVISAVRKRRSA